MYVSMKCHITASIIFSNIPDWLKSALMNELYYVADGGTIWFDVHDEYPESDPRYVQK
jgi:uncharacterized protein (DUF608 family)